jgi:hypothetical protein
MGADAGRECACARRSGGFHTSYSFDAASVSLQGREFCLSQNTIRTCSRRRETDWLLRAGDLPPKKWTGLGRHTFSESWADVAQGRMQAAGIVEALDILEEVG